MLGSNLYSEIMVRFVLTIGFISALLFSNFTQTVFPAIHIDLLNIVQAYEDPGAGDQSGESAANAETSNDNGVPSSNNDNETVADTGQNTAAGIDEDYNGNPADDPIAPKFTPPTTGPGGTTVPPDMPPLEPGDTTYDPVTTYCSINQTPTNFLSWSEATPNRVNEFQVIRYADNPNSSANGLRGYYFDNRDLSGDSDQWVDGTINLSNTEPVPYPRYFLGENFSVQWRGQLQAPETGAYNFYFEADDGVKFWLGSRKLTDDYDWNMNRTSAIRLIAGQRYSVTINYFNGSGLGYIRWYWKTPSMLDQNQQFQIVPQSTQSGQGVLYSLDPYDPYPPEKGQVIAILPSSARSFQDGGQGSQAKQPNVAPLITNKLYGYRLLAKGSGGAKASNAMSVRTLNCTPPPITSLTPSCPAANSPQIQVSWSNSLLNVNKYRLSRTQDGQNFTELANPLRSNSYSDNNSSGLTANQSYLYKLEATSLSDYISPPSFSNWVTAPDCSPPVINLSLSSVIDGITVTKNANDFPFLAVKQKIPVTIAWNTSNVPNNLNACTATLTTALATGPDSSPLTPTVIASWNGPKPNVFAGQNLPELTSIGDYFFKLECTSQWDVSTSSTITLKVTPLQKPFIQTTGGDVHTNESITIP